MSARGVSNEVVEKIRRGEGEGEREGGGTERRRRGANAE